MRVEGVEVVVAKLSLRDPIRSAGLTHRDRTTVFLRLVAGGAEGWGECSAYPGAREPDPTVVAIEPAAIDAVVQRFFAACPHGEIIAAESVADAVLVPSSVARRSVAAAVEMAVLDLELTGASRSLTSLLGVSAAVEVQSGSMVGIPRDRDLGRLVEGVGRALDAGARRVRVKIEPGWDHRPLEALRDCYPDAVMMADANGSFDPNTSSQVRTLDAYQLRCLEQPFAPRELSAHGELARTMSTPIGLDESLSSLARIADAVGSGACRVACIKPGRLGGVFAAVSAAQVCEAAGVACFVGGLFESGLARAVNAAVAGRPEFELPGDLGDPAEYLDANPFAYLATTDGLVRLSDEPGLGAVVRPEILAERTVARRWIPYRPGTAHRAE